LQAGRDFEFPELPAANDFLLVRRRLSSVPVNAAENPGQPAADPRQWLLDPDVVFLNHGSFGACPRPVLECQSEWRARMERQPVQFLGRELEKHLDHARESLAQFIGADAADLVFVPNATAGVNTVLRSLHFGRGDELLVTNHEYNATHNALDFAAQSSGARVVVAALPFPFRDADELIAPLLKCVTPQTRLVLLDHVTSQTGIILPLETLVGELHRRGVTVLVDGAHAPGMLPLNLNQLGTAFYTGNCHKWLCAPKGAAFLHARRDKQKGLRPLEISHGANSQRKDRSHFHLEFDWQGTGDPSAFLSVPEAIRFMGALLPGGWPEVMARNRLLAAAGRKILCSALQIEEPCPTGFLGSLAAVPLPDAPERAAARLPFNEYPLQAGLRERHRIEVPVISWPVAPHRVLRISAQLYNSPAQYEILAAALRAELAAE
jgi:isopenicillin-N epimerase